MWKFVFAQVFLTLLTTTAIVIRENKQDQNQVALVVNSSPPKTNRTCACTADEKCDQKSRTCRLSEPHHVCYQMWEVDRANNQIHRSAGCMRNDFFFVRLMCGANRTDRIVACCSNRDYCNELNAYSQGIRPDLLTTPAPVPRPPARGYATVSVIIAVSIIAAVLLLVIGVHIYIKQKRLRDRSNYPKGSPYTDGHGKQSLLHRFLKYLPCPGRLGANAEGPIPSDQSLTGLLDEFSTSTTGPALPLLMQRTLARQITIGESIGAGRYGNVYRGKWREDNVAVKIFSANDERSWFREIDIYQTVCLRHENILGYIAADNMDASTYTQLWLVTEYHENGSVYDYLMNHTIPIPILLKMMLSIASGLCHLHLPIDSTNGKVALAHRDLKTKNILVRKDLSCCIADLGLAVKEVRCKPKSHKELLLAKASNQEQVVIDIQANTRVGTLRYMAPEVLDGTLNERSFESFKAADIYALGLVYWEMLRRCRLNPTEDDADSYQVPYEDIQPNNPTAEQMREVVCTQKIRPSPSARWQKHPILPPLWQLCEELWTEEPTCRLSSLTVKRQLKKQMESLENDLSNINIESQQQSTQNDGPWTA